MSTGFNPCAVRGCDNKCRTRGRLCETHYGRLRDHGDVNYEPQPRGRALTDEQRIEVRRLVRQFVNPVEVARRVGVSTSTVNRVMRGES